MHVKERTSAIYESDHRVLNMMRKTSDDEEGIAIFYLGQAGFLLKRHGISIVIDPYLTDSVDRLPMIPEQFWLRRYAPPVRPDQLSDVDLVLCTHDHLDHIDPDTLTGIALASPGCLFAAPQSCVERLIRIGIPSEKIIGLKAEHPYWFRSIRIGSIPGAHETYDCNENGDPLYFGYIIEWDGISLYHSGDTLVTEQLIDTLSAYRIDVGFLPINGRDLFRNRLDIAGNMNAREAADLASMLRFDVVVPMHYDLYPNNGEPPSYFVDYMYRSHPGQKMHLFQPGERWVYHKPDRIRPVAVIIGAGKTGRGFVGRLLAQSHYEIVFIDKSEELVKRLNEDRAYSVHFFESARQPHRIKSVRAVRSHSPEAVETLANAAVIFTAVGEQHLPMIAEDLQKAAALRVQLGAGSPLDVIVCENGVSPGDLLRTSLEAAAGSAVQEIRIAEAAIFCSTVELNGTRLDILSESYDELPFDAGILPGFESVNGMVEVHDFKRLLQQKIYTYNCLSACIAYLGAFKGYERYADAANDEDIKRVLSQIIDPLNHAVSKLLKVPLEDQRSFAEQARRKFSDPNIRDNVDRNARDVARKLGPKDRLIVPALQIIENGQPVGALALVIAAALHYGLIHESPLQESLLKEGVIPTFARISGLPDNHQLTFLVREYYSALAKLPSSSSLYSIL